MKLSEILAAFLTILSGINAANILVAFPTVIKSHWAIGESYVEGLHARGHNVTVITPFKASIPRKNWTDVIIRSPEDNLQGGSGLFESSSQNNFMRKLKMFHWGVSTCEEIFQSANIKKLINSNSKFDIFIYEVFYNECLLALAHIFKIPVIAVCTHFGGAWTGDMVGNPSSFSYIPDPVLSYTDHMNFFERFHNTVFGMYLKIVRQFYFIPKQAAVVDKYISDTTMPSLTQIEKNVSLLLVNSHISSFYPRPLVPNMIEIGGIHVKPPRKLPPDLQDFLDTAHSGVVYFSMGSILKVSQMPEDKRSIFLKVFAKLKQKVLWKCDIDSLPGQSTNIKLVKWLPQADLLAHANVKLFITHGGLLSMQEALYHSVPIVGIPVFADQDLNSLRAEIKGYGKRIPYQKLKEELLYSAVTEVINDTSYQENMQQHSRIFHDRPRPPLEEAIYWTEYVLRYKGAKHLRSAALDLYWYQYLLLDVIIALLIGMTISCMVIIMSVKATLSLLTNIKSRIVHGTIQETHLKKQ